MHHHKYMQGEEHHALGTVQHDTNHNPSSAEGSALHHAPHLDQDNGIWSLDFPRHHDVPAVGLLLGPEVGGHAQTPLELEQT